MQIPIFVTRTLLPDQDLYAAYVNRIFTSRHMTNQGSCALQLEKELAAQLHVPHLTLCTNGTLALQLALHASGMAGKQVITTPFSYVATVSALLWEGCTPIFADIDEETLCLDPEKVAAKISSNTAGFLPVHIYGNICDVDALEAIAASRKLPILYDAAQCFGSIYREKSVLSYGDFAVCSFHATKVFHTVEGGGIITHSQEKRTELELLRAFGHVGDRHITLGINAKLSELHAAMGLSLLDRVAENIAARKKVSAAYDAMLPSNGLRRPSRQAGLTYNYSYYPIIFDDEKYLLRVLEQLEKNNVFPRRYFFPALNTLPYLPEYQPCPIAESLSRRVLCLPLYADLPESRVRDITTNIRLSL